MQSHTVNIQKEAYMKIQVQALDKPWGNNSTDPLILFSWSPELGDNIFLLFRPLYPQPGGLCYGHPQELIHLY